MKKLFILFFTVTSLNLSQAQTDSVYHIGLILPFQAASTTEKLEAYTNAHDLFTAQRIRLNDDAVISLDFYQGVLQALRENETGSSIELEVFDNWNSDSVTAEILKKPELKKLDLIIGSSSTSSAKLVADFCKQNKIVNVQPFSPSKTLASGNPYHLKLAPTIDAHVDALFNSMTDSFPGANVIIYTPNVEKSTSIAARFDSLFKDYNETTTVNFKVALLNTKDMLLNGKKTTAQEQLSKKAENIIIITSFDESFINGNLRLLHDNLVTDSITVYGMPTWLNGDILRLDYVNDFHTHLSDAFCIDSSRSQTREFMQHYYGHFSAEPTRFAYLGYDVSKFLLSNISDYGQDFLNHISTQHYNGTAYKFDIIKNSRPDGQTDFFENRYVNVLAVSNYRMTKVH